MRRKHDMSKESMRILMNQLKTFPKGSKPIMCECTVCKGIGFAQNETLLDQNGYLKDVKCPCGGKIRKVLSRV